MDFEAPVDALYVWIGVALVSIGLMGFAVSVPSEPPPDADRTAAALDRVAAGGPDAATAIEHGATEVRLDAERVELRNDAGSDAARLSHGRLLPLAAVDADGTERHELEAVLEDGRALDRTLEMLLADVVAELETATGDWQPTDGELRARAVTVNESRVVLVDG